MYRMPRKYVSGHGSKPLDSEPLYRSNVIHKKVEKDESPYAKKESVSLKHIKPDVSQGGLSGVKFIAHEAQSASHTFQPYPFDKKLESRLYSGVRQQLLNTHSAPDRVAMNEMNLMHNMGNAFNLMKAGHEKVGPKHKNNTVKGSLLGFKSATMPCRMGQVPFPGHYF